MKLSGPLLQYILVLEDHGSPMALSILLSCNTYKSEGPSVTLLGPYDLIVSLVTLLYPLVTLYLTHVQPSPGTPYDKGNVRPSSKLG